uniref:Uncharacterized protein n=1 Tax=Halimeda minima TaxID=170427 RepID=A0A386AYZ6_9CHLO|nr:hypothetical protein [Halimeda minima]
MFNNNYWVRRAPFGGALKNYSLPLAALFYFLRVYQLAFTGSRRERICQRLQTFCLSINVAPEGSQFFKLLSAKVESNLLTSRKVLGTRRHLPRTKKIKRTNRTIKQKQNPEEKELLTGDL